jgi:hypothetical protein
MRHVSCNACSAWSCHRIPVPPLPQSMLKGGAMERTLFHAVA